MAGRKSGHFFAFLVSAWPFLNGQKSAAPGLITE